MNNNMNYNNQTGQQPVNMQGYNQPMMNNNMNGNMNYNNQGGYNQPPVQPNMGYQNQMMNNMPYGMGSITFNRSNSIFGCALVFKVFLDGNQIGTIKRGESVKFDVPYGNHQLMLKSGLAKVESAIQVGDNSRNFVFSCSVKMGFLQGGINLELVNCYN